jgi:hypothetical protein
MLYRAKYFHHSLLLMLLIIEGILLSKATTPAFAGSPTVTGTIMVGSLGGTTATSYSFTGTPGSTITYPMPFISNDLRGTAAGWNISITSTTLTSSSGTIPAGVSTIIGTTATCTTPGTCSNDILTNTITGPVALPSALGTTPPAVKFFGTLASTGAGTYTVIPIISVSIPGGTLIGIYSSTVTLTISAI